MSGDIRNTKLHKGSRLEGEARLKLQRSRHTSQVFQSYFHNEWNAEPRS